MVNEERTKDEEIWELRRAFSILYTMITRGNNLFDISRTTSRLAQRVRYPFVEEIAPGLMVTDVGEEE